MACWLPETAAAVSCVNGRGKYSRTGHQRFGNTSLQGSRKAHKAGPSPCIWPAKSRKNCSTCTTPMGERTFSPALQLFHPSKLLAQEPSPDFKVQCQQLKNLWATRDRGQPWRPVAHAGHKSGAGLVPPQESLGLHLSAEWCSPELCPGVLQSQGAGAGVGTAVSTLPSQPSSDSLEGTGLMESLNLAQQRPVGCENQGQLVLFFSKGTIITFAESHSGVPGCPAANQAGLCSPSGAQVVTRPAKTGVGLHPGICQNEAAEGLEPGAQQGSELALCYSPDQSRAWLVPLPAGASSPQLWRKQTQFMQLPLWHDPAASALRWTIAQTAEPITRDGTGNKPHRITQIQLLIKRGKQSTQ